MRTDNPCNGIFLLPEAYNYVEEKNIYVAIAGSQSSNHDSKAEQFLRELK